MVTPQSYLKFTPVAGAAADSPVGGNLPSGHRCEDVSAPSPCPRVAPEPGAAGTAVEAVPTCAVTRGCPSLTGEGQARSAIPGLPESCVGACGLWAGGAFRSGAMELVLVSLIAVFDAGSADHFRVALSSRAIEAPSAPRASLPTAEGSTPRVIATSPSGNAHPVHGLDLPRAHPRCRPSNGTSCRPEAVPMSSAQGWVTGMVPLFRRAVAQEEVLSLLSETDRWSQ